MPTAPSSEPGLRDAALDALCLPDPQAKVQAAHALWQRLVALGDEDARERALVPAPSIPVSEGRVLPGRPPRPVLVPPMAVPQRSPFTSEGLAALLHAVCHIEFNAIDLALDAVWRFAGMPAGFYRDWLRVADEEATHFGLLREHLQSLGHDYGDFPAHNGLWEMCVKTQHDITARMALVPRTLEARGLDATPLIQARLRKVGTPAALRAVDILDIILRDEVGHVAIGNRWYAWLCERQGLEPVSHYRHLARLHAAPRLRPPFNDEARRAAGFSQAELDDLLSA
ncbi:ferritin-like domain-containing protein [Hydrogenophaga pseudoflava]|uniref:ferritin-like domain-containing protein n=1 Tax=Hydrogenophaga pseudoflava TaxID=47421 RepID=UPI0027E3D703|nr:ferritin-like domain-containing protein [Hydrogenophaga pseudoflava]MDQ7745568.1 ferritin-like domain-containing protein [Hydrogenophaga pseudoflava]